jgi:flagellar biosynthesis GTPase FlhF
MKKIALTAGTLLLMCVAAFAFLQTLAVRSLERVGIPVDVAKQCVWSSMSGGYLSYPNITKVRTIAIGQRAAAVREIADFARRYTQTADFRDQYLQYRDGQKPTAPEVPMTSAQRRAKDKEESQRNIREMENTVRQLPADQRPAMQQAIDMMRQQLREIDNPDNPMYTSQMEDYEQQAYRTSMEEYNTKLAEWEREYPTNPKPLIKKWLTKFLEVSKNVDYGAALKRGEEGKMLFVNADYEAKPPEWKMCYRAGRDVVHAGRTEAQQWLNELNRTQ